MERKEIEKRESLTKKEAERLPRSSPESLQGSQAGSQEGSLKESLPESRSGSRGSPLKESLPESPPGSLSRTDPRERTEASVFPEDGQKPNSSNPAEKLVQDLLCDLGIPSTMKGSRYCREAILLVRETEEVYGSLSNDVYPEIGRKYHTSASSVEKALRSAIEKGWNQGNRDAFRRLLGDAYYPIRGRPSTGELLCAAKSYLEDLL